MMKVDLKKKVEREVIYQLHGEEAKCQKCIRYLEKCFVSRSAFLHNCDAVRVGIA